MKREYIGRCDMCGKKLYEDDVYVSVYPVIGAAATVCCDCSDVAYKENCINLNDLIKKYCLLEDDKE